MDKLKIITDNQNDPLFVGGEGEDSFIAYKDTSGKLVIVSNSVWSIEKPIKCSELYQKLKGRAWNKMDGTKFINLDQSKDLMLKTYDYVSTLPSGEIETITSNDYIYSKTSQPAFFVFGYLIKGSICYNNIENVYSNLFGNMKASEEVYFHNSSKNTVDILNSSVTIDYIRSDSDTYTNTVSLCELINYASTPGITGKVNLTIQYTKSAISNIYTSDFTFTAFKYKEEDGSTTLERNNFIKDFNDDVELEYIDGVIKLSPLNDNINEYIINNCSVTYGNLE